VKASINNELVRIGLVRSVDRELGTRIDHIAPTPTTYPIVLDLVSQVRNVVLMNVYLGLGDSGGSGFWNWGYMSQGREMGS
jgi:hypothetical protein